MTDRLVLVLLKSVSEILPVPLAGGLLIPATKARLHENAVPVSVLAGIKLNNELSHIAGVKDVMNNAGRGFTVTVAYTLSVLVV